MNPPRGATVYYHLGRKPAEDEKMTLEFLDASGAVVRSFSNQKDKDTEATGAPEVPLLPAKPGLNRFTWDLRYPDATRFKGLILWGGGLEGPLVVPGRYQVRLTAAGHTQTRAFEVRRDPRLTTTAEDYQKRFDLRMKIRDKLSEIHEAITRLRDVREQAKAVGERAQPDTTIAATARELSARLTAIEEALYQTKNQSSQDPLNYPIRLNNKLSSLAEVIDSADAPPTDPSQAVFADLVGRIDAELAKLRTVLDQDLAGFNRMVREKDVPAVKVKQDRKRP
jgi:hypothetical protein